jgi:hypothetical protein
MERSMNELLAKVSSYNLFNYLLPGVILAVLARDVLHYPVASLGVITEAFVCYFLGLVVSRFGSLIIEPVLKRTSFVRFANYKDFVAASAKDANLALLSEANNMYRTMCSLFCLVILLKLYMRIEAKFSFLKDWDATVVVVLLLTMFLFSYRKQTAYITKRINANK